MKMFDPSVMDFLGFYLSRFCIGITPCPRLVFSSLYRLFFAFPILFMVSFYSNFLLPLFVFFILLLKDSLYLIERKKTEPQI